MTPDGVRTLLSRLEEALSFVESLDARLDQYEAMFNQLASQAVTAISDAGEVLIGVDRISVLAESIRSVANDVDEAVDNIESQVEEAAESIDDSLDALSEACEESLDEAFDEIADFTEEVVSEICDKADEVLDEVEDGQEVVANTLQELYSTGLPASFSKDTDKLLSGIQSLKDCGLEEARKLEDKLGVITDRTRMLTDLVDEVKPVLELVRQVL